MECVQIVSYNILINSEPSEPFNAAKGLRQGNPISPFFFAIGMECLSSLLYGLKEMKRFQFHPKYAKLNINHLFFYDDLLLISRGDVSSMSVIHSYLQMFSLASRLLANIDNSLVYFDGVK